MVIPSLSDAEAAELFPNGVTTKELPSGKKYLRYTQPWASGGATVILDTTQNPDTLPKYQHIVVLSLEDL